jgi:effector protein LidA
MNKQFSPAIDPRLSSQSQQISPELNEWLDHAIQAKASEMRFEPPSPTDFDADSPINISRFGFKNPGDLKIFLLSPAGETVKAEIGTQLAQEEAIKEEQRFEQQEQAKLHSLIKIHLLLWLMAEDDNADKALRELANEQNAKLLTLNNQPSKAAHHETQPHDFNKELQQALTSYNEKIRQNQLEHANLVEAENDLEHQINALAQQKTNFENKSEEYTASLDKFEQESEVHEQRDDTNLDQLISTMEKEMNDQTNEISRLLDQGSPEEEQLARELLNKQNALNLQLASLYDLRDQRKKKKLFFNEQGKQVERQKDAAYVVDNEHKIVRKNDKLYLLKSEENIDEISDDRLKEAGEQFEQHEHEFMSVKKAVKHSLDLENKFHNFDERLMEAQNKQQETAKAKTAIENQIRTLQSIRENLSSEIAKNVSTTKPSSTPKPTPGSTMPTPSMSKDSIIFAVKFLNPFMKKPDVSTDQLMHKFNKFYSKANENDKKKVNPEEIKDLLKRIINQLTLGQIPSFAPLPHSTMQSLLQNMERFGQSAYKVSAEISPLQLAMGQANMPESPLQAPTDSPMNEPQAENKKELDQHIHPTPFSMDPFK